ncbi:hypothetical protein LTR37_014506 [Vermiconidia calcicola]|uniref:Uncharacterized protein n=1 Tax=Vermiconidia calcicola TaxID=1690605 RepID=A0ACC3MTF8_9PEZI|nr:hypothetical protein LTR37_014506 [Vermiconidia calcicola]
MDFKEISEGLGGSPFPDEYRGNFEEIGNALSKRFASANTLPPEAQSEILLLQAVFLMLKGELGEAEKVLTAAREPGDGRIDQRLIARCKLYNFYCLSLREYPPILRFRAVLESSAATISNAELQVLALLTDVVTVQEIMRQWNAGPLDLLEAEVLKAIHTFNTTLQFSYYSHPMHWESSLRCEALLEPFSRDVWDLVEQTTEPKIEAHLNRLVLLYQLGRGSSESTRFLNNLRKQYYENDDYHGAALTYMVEGDSINSPPFTSPLALNLITVVQGLGWEHERWDPIEHRFSLRMNAKAERCYSQAMHLYEAAASPRGQAAVLLRRGCMRHAEAVRILSGIDNSLQCHYSEADAAFKQARVLFEGDLTNSLIVGCHQLLLDLSRGLLQRTSDVILRTQEFSRRVKGMGSSNFAQFIGTLILRFARWQFVVYRRTNLALACCTSAYALFSICEDSFMELQTLVAHADLLEQSRDLDGAQIKVNAGRADDGPLRKALHRLDELKRGHAMNTTLSVARQNALDNFDRVATRVYQAVGRSDVLSIWRAEKAQLERSTITSQMMPPVLPPRPAYASTLPPPLPPRPTGSQDPVESSSHTRAPPARAAAPSSNRTYPLQSSKNVTDEDVQPIRSPQSLMQQLQHQIDTMHQAIANVGGLPAVEQSAPIDGTSALLTEYNNRTEEGYELLDQADVDAWNVKIESIYSLCDQATGVPAHEKSLYKMIAASLLGNLDLARSLLPDALPREFCGTGKPSVADKLRPFAVRAGMQAHVPIWKAQAAERALSFCVLAQDWRTGSKVLDAVIKDLPHFDKPENLPEASQVWREVSDVAAIHEHNGRHRIAFEWYLNALRRLEALRNAARLETRRNCHSTIHSGEIFSALVRLSLFFGMQTSTIRGLPHHWNLTGPTWRDQALLFLERGRARALLDFLVVKQNIDPGLLASRSYRRQLVVGASVQRQGVQDAMDATEIRRRLGFLQGGSEQVTNLDRARGLLDHDQEIAESMTIVSEVVADTSQLYNSIPRDTIVIEVNPSRQGLGILCISRDGIKSTYQSPMTDIQLRGLVLPFVKKCQTLNSSKFELMEIAAKISEVILSPFERFVRDTKNIVFVHSHALQALPCSAYVLDGKPLFLQKVTYQIPSLAVLHEITKPLLGKFSAGITAFTSSTAAGASRSSVEYVNRLDKVAAEVTAIAQAFSTVPIDLDDLDEAGSSLKHLMEESLAVFVATHGHAIHPEPWQSCLDAKSRFRVLDMAALRKCAPLVVFTACWAGLGSATVGNDILGFSHAVLASGARIFIAGLWTLDAQVSMLLMVTFFRELAAHASTTTVAEIWRRVQVTMYNLNSAGAKAILTDIQNAWKAVYHAGTILRNFNYKKVFDSLKFAIEEIEDPDEEEWDYQHPFYWAAYNLVGNGDLVIGADVNAQRATPV